MRGDGGGYDVERVSVSDEVEGTIETGPIQTRRRQLTFAMMCAANIGGVFWPYASHTSIVLYRLVKR